ncbi:hypothetical protein CS022_18185 [Veronia nyctiphanis]|uniref:Uncharacterized protein n=2 Tax=Veronia nyctiphanis TaxID=1278244 RepID=A0A4Q0YMG4_9GAMM|nr:hypothetical protein CS022_18085 [Veronia nyctiphanis]RXJ72058.1 hypothetical protein CS022_18185 [Veronia nyctiphanis]
MAITANTPKKRYALRTLRGAVMAGNGWFMHTFLRFSYRPFPGPGARCFATLQGDAPPLKIHKGRAAGEGDEVGFS